MVTIILLTVRFASSAVKSNPLSTEVSLIKHLNAMCFYLR